MLSDTCLELYEERLKISDSHDLVLDKSPHEFLTLLSPRHDLADREIGRRRTDTGDTSSRR